MRFVISSTSSSSSSARRRRPAVAIAAACLFACAAARPARAPSLPGTVAVLPLSNLSGGPAPLKELRGQLEQSLRDRGVTLVPDAAVEEFLARHRLRWTGGIDADSAKAAAAEMGATAVLVTSADLYQNATPPSIGLRARLVATGESANILWVDARAHIGDESPGLLDLGIVNDIPELQQKTISELTGSLAAYLGGRGASATKCDGGGRFGPQASYRSPKVAPAAKVAILPFVNETLRRDAGEVVSLEFLRQLQASGLSVVEPGLLRNELLNFRIVVSEGVTLDAARVVMELLHADYVLAGTVREFQGTATSQSAPAVQFTAMLLDRRNEEVVWEVSSYHRGDEGVFFFDAGHVDTALDLSCRMVRSAVDAMLQGANSPSSTQSLRPPEPW
jgi:hypothetical protein